MGSRSQSLRELETISTNSGIGCPRGATSLHRCGGWTSRKRLGDAAVGHSHGRGSHRARGCPAVSGASLEPLFHATPMGTDPAARRSMPCGRRVSAAGATTGCSTSTSRRSSTRFHMSCSSGAAGTYRLPLGVALCRALVEGAGAKGGWLHGASGCRNAAGIGRKSDPGEPVSALRVRHVDDTEVSGCSV